MNNADDHMRMIKAVLKGALAGVNAAMTRAVSSTFAMIMPDGTASDPSYSFASEPTLGICRGRAGVMNVVGGVLHGVLPVGGIHTFIVTPTGLGTGGSGSGWDYLELDGSTWANSSFPALAAHLGQGGTTFVLPDLKTNGRFLRSRSSFQTLGNYAGNQNQSHTHTFSGTSGGSSNDHTHGYSGTTSSMNRNSSHTHSVNTAPVFNNVAAGGSFGNAWLGGFTPTATGSTNTDHEHTFSGTTGGVSSDHTHGYSGTTSSNGGSEARPECFAVIHCIKT